MAVRKPLVVINGGLSEVPAADTIEVNWAGVLAKPVAIVALAALVPIANTIAYFDSTTTAALAVQSAYARTLIDDPDAPTARGTLGLGTAAVENIGTSGNVVPKLNAGNTWSASQVIDAPGPLTLTWTDDGTIAVALVFDRISSTPAAADRLGTFQMKGRNSAAASIIYGSFTGNISNVTAGAETTYFNFNGLIGGTSAELLRIGDGIWVPTATGGLKGAGTINATALYENNVAISSKYLLDSLVTTYAKTLLDDPDAPTARGTLGLGTAAVVNTGTGGATVPLLNTSPAWTGTSISHIRQDTGAGALVLGNLNKVVGGDIYQILFRALDVTDVIFDYASLRGVIVDPTNAAEAGGFEFRTAVAGTLTRRMHLRQGLYSDGVVGNDKGLGTANFATYYENNIALSAKYFLAASVSAYGATLIDDVDAPTARGTLGLGTVATQNVGTSGATVPLLNTTVVFSGNSISLTRPDTGLADLNIGSQLAAPGTIGTIFFQGLNTSAAVINYAGVRGTIVTATAGATAGRIELRTAIAGNLVTRFNVDLGFWAVGVTGADKGAGAINVMEVYESNSRVWTAASLPASSFFITLADDVDAPTARGTLGLGTAATANTGTSGAVVPFLSGNNIWSSDMEIRKGGASTGSMTIGGQMQNNGTIVGQFVFQGWDSAGNNTQYGMIRGAIVDNTDGSEDGRVVIRTITNGAGTDALYCGTGVHTPGQTDQGLNTINAAILFESNVSLVTKYSRLTTSNVFTAGNRFPALNSIILSINDDAVGSITLLAPGGSLILVDTRGNPATTSGPRGIWFAATNANVLTPVAALADANLDTLTNTVLTGTTGTDGKFTISVHSTGIYFENRTGSARTVDVCIIGGY